MLCQRTVLEVDSGPVALVSERSRCGQIVRELHVARDRSAEDQATCAKLLTRITDKSQGSRIRQIRIALATGVYEDAYKIEVAVEKILDELGSN